MRFAENKHGFPLFFDIWEIDGCKSFKYNKRYVFSKGGARMGHYTKATVRETKSFTKHLFICLKWIFFALILGVSMGSIGAAFSLSLKYVTAFRLKYGYIILLLPFAGLLITFLYKKFGSGVTYGTNMVLAAINSDEKIPFVMLPLIFVSSVISHLFGASVGREGAALQMGASVGNAFAGVFKLNENDTKILIMTGMSAAFSALFGTPFAAAIFSMEVVSVGVMYYSALVPCVVSSLTAISVAKRLGVSYMSYSEFPIPEFTAYTSVTVIILGIFCSIISILLCSILIMSERGLVNHISNPYLRVFLAGLTIVAAAWIFGTQDYNGLGTDVIYSAVAGEAVWYAFLVKMILTAISISGGYKGGEIVPVLFIGATFGCTVAPVLGLPPSFCAALGMTAVFCGVTNTPIASILIGIELFGSEMLWFLCLVIAISYMLSGYYGIYKSQLIIYSKYRSVYVHKQAHR